MSGTDKIIAQLNLDEDGVYIIQNGKIIDVLFPKDFGQDIINWQHGKVFEVCENHRRRFSKK